MRRSRPDSVTRVYPLGVWLACLPALDPVAVAPSIRVETGGGTTDPRARQRQGNQRVGLVQHTRIPKDFDRSSIVNSLPGADSFVPGFVNRTALAAHHEAF